MLSFVQWHLQWTSSVGSHVGPKLVCGIEAPDKICNAGLKKPKTLFGNDGNLCHPWGICCSRDGLILAASGLSDRIVVYDKLGQFLYNFGKSGKQNGEFKCPTSVTCDSKNRVIVTDKGNHRIQIFNIKGEFLQKFGQRGSMAGELKNPWDVACNSHDCILVSDTGNYRIQLFDPNGQFIAKYELEGKKPRPRGVCFTPDDQIVITDFKLHRLIVVAKDFTTAKYLVRPRDTGRGSNYLKSEVNFFT